MQQQHPLLPIRRRTAALALVLSSIASGAAWGQSVALQGMLGTRALLMVDGSSPKGVAVGDTFNGVKVLSTTRDSAVVELANGQHLTLRLGESQASVGESGSLRGKMIVLSADASGHFVTNGSINGKTARFMVDTGASVVGLGADDAERMGINYRSGQPTRTNTANGVGMAWLLKLSTVRIGEVELHDVDALVTSQPMPYVLLGNSFLNRFQMRRDNEVMTLERRY